MPKIALVRTVAALSPEARGKLMDAAEVSAAFFSGKVSKKWVFANVPGHYRHKVGRLILYYEGEIRAWVETLRQVA
jgi:hypothetical protein